MTEIPCTQSRSEQNCWYTGYKDWPGWWVWHSILEIFCPCIVQCKQLTELESCPGLLPVIALSVGNIGTLTGTELAIPSWFRADTSRNELSAVRGTYNIMVWVWLHNDSTHYSSYHQYWFPHHLTGGMPCPRGFPYQLHCPPHLQDTSDHHQIHPIRTVHRLQPQVWVVPVVVWYYITMITLSLHHIPWSSVGP